MEKQVMLIDADVSLAEQLEQRDQTCFEGGGVAFEQYLSQRHSVLWGWSSHSPVRPHLVQSPEEVDQTFEPDQSKADSEFCHFPVVSSWARYSALLNLPLSPCVKENDCRFK